MSPTRPSRALTRGVHTRRVEVQRGPALEEPGVHIRRYHHPAGIKVHRGHGWGPAQRTWVQGLGGRGRSLWSRHRPHGHGLRWGRWYRSGWGGTLLVLLPLLLLLQELLLREDSGGPGASGPWACPAGNKARSKANTRTRQTLALDGHLCDTPETEAVEGPGRHPPNGVHGGAREGTVLTGESSLSPAAGAGTAVATTSGI